LLYTCLQKQLQAIPENEASKYAFDLKLQIDAEANAAVLDRCHQYMQGNGELVGVIRTRWREMYQKQPAKLTPDAIDQGVVAVLTRVLKQRSVLSCSWLLESDVCCFLLTAGSRHSRPSTAASRPWLSLHQRTKLVSNRRTVLARRSFLQHSRKRSPFCLPWLLAGCHAASQAVAQLQRPHHVESRSDS